ncbi:MAG: SusC/RagA family TonB-linked outer membrane protein [Prevotella sp.]|nr:SusC/RagA family TonB-linked outer membrane protein [Prevotella sp.]
MLLTPLSALRSFAQEANDVISGTVSDALGPIMQANVVEIDNANRIVSSTTTDMNGNFSFKIKSPKNKLRFSFVGCKPKTVAIKGTVYDITLDDETTLTEVTVVSKGRGNGSGLSIPHNELSTSNQTISTKEFEGLALTTIDEALQGRIAGLDIVGNSGNLGSGTSMRLRGVSSINGSSEPLIVVDGNVWESDRNSGIDISSANDEKFAELLNVNPEDIESISVLKDAAATAIWGSQGANGVIEIKLKRGSRGKTRVGYSYRLTGTWQPKGYNMLTGDEYTMLQKEAYFNPRLSSGESNIEEFNYSSGNIGWQNYAANTDWVSEVQKTGWRQNHYLSLTGGGEKANFRIGAGYDHETGSIIKQVLDRLTSRVALDYFVSDRIKIITNLAFTYTKNQKNYNDLLNAAYRRMPNIPVFARDDNGNDLDYYFNIPTTISPELRDQVGDVNNLGAQVSAANPVALANLAKNEDTSYKISPEFQLVYNLLGVEEGKTQLKYEGKIVFDIFNNYVDTFLPSTLNAYTYSNANNNRSTSYAYKSLGITTTHTLTFVPHFKNEDHSMMMMLRGQLVDGSSTTQKTAVYGLPTGTIQSTGAEAVIGSDFSSTAGQWRSLYFTYSVHYAYKSRYMADFSIRRDGSTKFGPDNRWGTFPAFSLRWNISSEPWIKEKLPWLSMLSVRPGVGIVGTQPNADYLFYSKYRNGNGYMGGRSTYPANIQLKQLKWEEKKTWNLGFDFGFFNDKLTGNLELYRQYTKDLLMMNRSIAASSGYTKLDYDNVGKMENVGWEFNINTNNLIKFGKLGIDLNVTFANNRNIITEMDETCLKSLNDDFNHNNGSYMTRVEIDKPFGAIYGFRYKGVYQYTKYTAKEVPGVSGPNAPVARDAMGNVVTDDKGIAKPMTFCYGTSSEYEFKGGDAMYEDINHDGTINELDIVYLGSSLPKITGGFGIKFKFGRWTLNNQFNFRYGNKIINANRMNAEAMYNNNNQSRAVNYRWRVEGDISEIPRALHQSGYNWLGSDRFVEDGSFLRLNYTQLSYSFPTKTIKKWGLTQLSFHISAQNVFCITKYSGADPEVGYGGYGIVMDRAQTPKAKSITGGITIQF